MPFSFPPYYSPAPPPLHRPPNDPKPPLSFPAPPPLHRQMVMARWVFSTMPRMQVSITCTFFHSSLLFLSSLPWLLGAWGVHGTRLSLPVVGFQWCRKTLWRLLALLAEGNRGGDICWFSFLGSVLPVSESEVDFLFPVQTLESMARSLFKFHFLVCEIYDPPGWELQTQASLEL